ncbi:protein kinase MEC1 [Sugiyamaella lignohabitans]|uniref:non-specific serine/threonine protein kinase n=1 Tax=Sugiyamaella lignohabitans TaxID=796027 RepID=A0A161HFJ3_9ASCO|nr:protein kinase MEC1 [Sugiyamaella lignohabitans]ANB14310.1 protein kinase MEC1 [Sugiyamaella lignohabitans]
MSSSEDISEPAVWMGKWVFLHILPVLGPRLVGWTGNSEVVTLFINIVKRCLLVLTSAPPFWPRLEAFKKFLRSIMNEVLDKMTVSENVSGDSLMTGSELGRESVWDGFGIGNSISNNARGLVACLSMVQALMEAETKSNSHSLILNDSDVLKLLTYLNKLWQQMHILLVSLDEKKSASHDTLLSLLEEGLIRFWTICSRAIELKEHVKFGSSFASAGVKAMDSVPKCLVLSGNSVLDVCCAEFVLVVRVRKLQINVNTVGQNFQFQSEDEKINSNLLKACLSLSSASESVATVKNVRFSSSYIQNLRDSYLNWPVFQEPPVVNPDMSASQVVFERAFLNCTPLKKLPSDISTKLASGSLKDITLFISSSIFTALSVPDKQLIIRHIGVLGCMLSESYVSSIQKCRVCDRPTPVLDSDRPSFNEGFHELFLALIHSDHFQEESGLRLETLHAMKRVYTSYCPDFAFNNKSDLGIWLIACLRSTSREIRVACTRILPCFITVPDPQADLQADNIFKFLSSINFEADTYLFETTIMAWGQIARHSRGDRLNFILMRLLEYLGSSNAFHSSVAYHEITGIARSKNLTCWQLFTPFWSTISVVIVKQMVVNKSLLKRFAELLHIPTVDFLQRTTSFTVPYLVLAKKYDAVEMIAEACGSTSKKIYLDHVPMILAVLLTQDVPNPEVFAEQRWLDADPSFGIVEFADVISPNIQGLSFELLKLAPSIGPEGVISETGDETSHESGVLHRDYYDNGKALRIENALKYLASMKYGLDGAKSLPLLFSEGHVLQLVAQFADTVRNLSGRKSYTVKLQCIRGISMMMRFADSSLSSAVPQICAFLQSALDTQELQQTALQAWHIMTDEVNDLESILDLTFCVVVQKWSQLLPAARKEAQKMVENIIVNKQSKLLPILPTKGVPSLANIPELQNLHDLIRKQYPKFQGVSHFYFSLSQLVQRSNSENRYVVRQTLQELSELLLNYQDEIQASLNREKLLDHIKYAIRSLLNITFAFRSSDTDIPLLCSQCLGLIGAIDRHKVDISPEHDSLIVLHNFDEAKESIMFVSKMIEEFLIRSFKASTDPSVQMFLAYGIQEYLKFCNINEDIVQGKEPSEVWERFSSSSKPYLIPLASTRYSAPAPPLPNESSPIFSSSISYPRWLQAFTYSLMSKARGVNAGNIFTVCRKMVRDRDHFQSLFDFVLPYVSLNVVIGGTEHDRNALLDEISKILTTTSHPFDDMGQFHRRIFTILDYFNKWMRAMKKMNSNRRRAQPIEQAESVEIIDKFLRNISPDLMAQRSYESKSFPRAIMYWEQHLKDSSLPSASELAIYSKFQEIYAQIDEPDAFDGVTTLIPSLGLDKQILQYETTGRWHEALECYEVLSESEVYNWDLNTELKMFNCMKESGRYDDLLTRLEDSVRQKFDVPEQLISLGIEVSWLSGRWQSLEKWLSCTTNDTYESNVGNALLALREKRADELQHRIVRAREKVASGLSSNYVTSLGQCTEAFVRLHALADLESIGSLACALSGSDELRHEDFSVRLDKRLAVVGPEFDARRYLLALRRSAVSVSGLIFASQEVAMTWVSSAHDARKQDQPTLALRAILQATALDNRLAKVEYAKLLWKQGEQRKAVTTLESAVDRHFLYEESRFIQDPDVSKADAKAALLYTRWIDYSDQADSDTILSKYQAVTFVSPKWEKAYYHLARYYNKIFDYQTTLAETMRTDAYLDGSLVNFMVKAYCRSLQYGAKYVYETMPKLITIWLDFSSVANKLSVSNFSNGTKILKARIESSESNNSNVRKLATKIPSYMVSN